jgi:hypothetical protein
MPLRYLRRSPLFVRDSITANVNVAGSDSIGKQCEARRSHQHSVHLYHGAGICPSHQGSSLARLPSTSAHIISIYRVEEDSVTSSRRQRTRRRRSPTISPTTFLLTALLSITTLRLYVPSHSPGSRVVTDDGGLQARGFPDISAIGVNYVVFAGGQPGLVYGE